MRPPWDAASPAFLRHLLPVAFCVLGQLVEQPMRFIGSVIEKLQRHPKRIVFPEGTEPRVLQAARQFYSLRLGAPILLGDGTKIKEVADALNISLEGIRIINPAESEDLDNFARRFEVAAPLPKA